MARKKKAKDARGYSQGGPQQQHQRQQTKQSSSCSSNNNASSGGAATTKSKAPAVSTKTHNDMKDLLDRFDNHAANVVASSENKNNSTVSSSAAPPQRSDRFATKLTNVVDRLDELGFANDHVESAAKALGYEITLETALDYLCLNLTASELPALFTDGDARRSLADVVAAESLTVVKESAPVSLLAENDDNILAVDRVKSNNDGGDRAKDENEREGLEKRKEKERQKLLLLQQYQYEEEEEEEEGDGNDKVELPETREVVDISLSPDEQKLAEEERALKEMQADANNDANNYMRSKAEIKQLKNEANKMRGKVAGLRKKIQRAKAQERKLQQEKVKEEAADVSVPVVKEVAKEEKEEEGGTGGGFFDVFAKDDNKDEEKATTSTVEDTAPAAPKAILDFPISAKWTGMTPHKKLEEALKKQKLPKAKYAKLPRNGGYALTVTMDKDEKPLKWEAKTADFTKDSALKDYVATHALYEMDPTVQLYQIFPPAFRDLWLSWMNEVKDKKDRVRRLEEGAKKDRIDRLMGLIGGMRKDQHGGGVGKKNGSGEKKSSEDDDDPHEEDEIMDNWDDDSVDEVPAKTNKARSVKGSVMRPNFFAKRQSTPSYQKMKAIRDALPMASYRSTVLQAVENNPVVILCAETGAGKSTQCAQYILEQALLDNDDRDAVNIICTQPRRVAATSLAERVADEMCDRLGDLVGYQIRMESKRSSRTRLMFCTTGVVLRRLQDDPALTGISHVIVDEVHERQQQIDVLLIILRRMLQTTRPDLKVILMSATMETELFSSFFHQSAPVINVPGRTFPVSSYYLEDLLDATGHVIEEGSRYAIRENYYGETASMWVTTRGGEKRKETVDLTLQTQLGGVSDMYTGYNMTTRRSMERVNEEVINYDLIEDILKLVANGNNDSLVAPDGADMSRGSILVFLPGLGEIKSLIERLDGSRFFRDKQRFALIPLHSTLSSSDQRRAFLPSQPGCRKIICATNIAETSVTIPDVVCVIDTGRVREVRRNKKTSTSMLVTDWCPRSSAKQRQGRAGRVQSGICLKLYSSRTAESIMKTTNEPEIRRVPLEEVCMSILASGFATNCMEFLDQAPQPPSKDSVQAAIDVLYEVGAIERTMGQQHGYVIHQTERLTPLGQHLAKLPVDVKLGKMLIFGALFGCIDPALTIAASLSSKSPFSTYVNDGAVAKAKHKVFADPDSDFMTYCNVWDAYTEAAESSASAGRRFCQENYLNNVALREIGDARRQYLDLLCGIGFLDRNLVMGNNGSRIDLKRLKSCFFNRHAKKSEVIHTVTFAGLYPHIARLEQTASMNHSMWHKEERIYFHRSSVNGAKKSFPNSGNFNWVVFHEKFGTPNRTSVSTTAFVHPFALLLFGRSVAVKHIERRVIVDDWMSIGMPAQTSLTLRELQKKLDLLLQSMIEYAGHDRAQQMNSSMIDGIINILST